MVARYCICKRDDADLCQVDDVAFSPGGDHVLAVTSSGTEAKATLWAISTAKAEQELVWAPSASGPKYQVKACR